MERDGYRLSHPREHDRLLGAAVEPDHLRQHLGAEHRQAAGFLLEDDLQQDRAREVVPGLGVDDLEVDAFEHHQLDVGEGDVAAVGGVVQPPVGVLLDRADLVAHGSNS